MTSLIRLKFRLMKKLGKFDLFYVQADCPSKKEYGFDCLKLNWNSTYRQTLAEDKHAS